ncbi:hypothetical protein ACRQ5D_32570 [Mucilaginibacter sp. P25]|uniref:hypothetical protein n=1 Tax=unclassified Mucilaginibacter TaxID=2617802 RepID=UPI003D671E4D
MVRTSAVALIVCLLPLLATAQPGNRDARKPAAGETMRFSYNTGAPGAELNGHNKLFIRVTSYFQDGSLRTYHPRLRRVQKLFVAYFRIPKDAASLQAVFYDRTKDARRSATESPVYTRDTRVPVRGAFLQTLYTDKPDSIFLREIVRYTNNFLAYAKYINIVSMIRPDSSGQLQIAGLRRRLEYYYRHSRTTSNAGLLTALCIAAVKNGDPLAGKEYLTKALNDFPTSAESDFAFSIYNYEHYKASGRGPGEDILPLIKRIFMKYPAAEISRDPDVWNALKDDLSIPVEAFEKVRRATCRTGTLHYYDLNRLPELYIARRKKLTDAVYC